MSDTLNKMSMDEFRRQQKEVLASWPTGKDVNFQEAVDYHKSLPDSKVFSKKLEQARKDKVTPVSYTHLDVYKRQGPCCSVEPTGTSTIAPSSDSFLIWGLVRLSQRYGFFIFPLLFYAFGAFFSTRPFFTPLYSPFSTATLPLTTT